MKTIQNDLILGRLAIERCQNYLAHLHAIMYLCEPRDMGLEEDMAENARSLMAAISRDLALGARALRGPDVCKG